MTPLADAVVVPQMEGVTTAIVAFIFVCVIYPHLVKNKTQFYAAFAAVLTIILLHSLSAMIGTAGFQVFAGFLTGLLQLGAVLLLFTSCGGVSLRELGGEMANAFEVIRRGETEKTVIVPLSGEMPKPKHERAAATATTTAEPTVEKIDLPPTAGWPTQSAPPASRDPERPPPRRSDDSSIPLE